MSDLERAYEIIDKAIHECNRLGVRVFTNPDSDEMHNADDVRFSKLGKYVICIPGRSPYKREHPIRAMRNPDDPNSSRAFLFYHGCVGTIG